ncbi:MAG: hypothetical protein ACTS46_00415 [Candidatus Hodgkinia cicadicola]
MFGMPHSKQMAFGSGQPKGNSLNVLRLKEVLAQQTEDAKLCIAHFKLKVETSNAITSPFKRRESAAEPQPKHQTSLELVKRLSTRLRTRDLETFRPLRRGRLWDNGIVIAEKRGRGESRNGFWWTKKWEQSLKQVSKWLQNVGTAKRNVRAEAEVLRKDWRELEGKLTFDDVAESREGVGIHQKSWEMPLRHRPRPNTQGDAEVRKTIKANESCLKVHKRLCKLTFHVRTFDLNGKNDWAE